MVNKVRTIDFLPEIFQTETNEQFLSATLDVLTQPQQLDRVQGFIGEKYGYSVASNDKYVVEPTKTRADYQLSPSVTFLKPDTQVAQDFIDYPGIVKALQNEGAITENNQRLFEQEFYSWDGFINYDKIVNYGQYYWIPDGPDSVLVETVPIPSTETIAVTRGANGYTFSNLTTTQPDQAFTLVRGGTYRFVVNQDTPFWLQGVTGLTGLVPQTTVNSRNVDGVVNNGAHMGVITFTVPAKDAQDQYIKNGDISVDVVSTGQISDINGKTQSSANPIVVDGVTLTDGTKLMFYNNGVQSTQTNFYRVGIDPSTKVITLTTTDLIYTDQKITAKYGTAFRGQTFYRDNVSFLITEIPYISSLLDTIYYQDGTNPDFYGQINLVADNFTNYIDVNTIIGQTQYTSPNGINFINGLKIAFNSNVIPSSYANKEYYVEGVGSSIALLPVTAFQIPETQNYPTNYSIKEVVWDYFIGEVTPDNQADIRNQGWSKFAWSGTRVVIGTDIDYITISRNSRDYNAWTRSNRWFHQDVIDTVIAVNGYISNKEFNTPTRAQRPVIEYYGNLNLFDSGNTIGGVDLVSTTTADAFKTIQNATVSEYGISNVMQSTSAQDLAPTVVTLFSPAKNDDGSPVFPDGTQVTFNNVNGMTQLNLAVYYVKNPSGDAKNFQLFTDAALTQPLNTFAFFPYLSGGTMQYNYFIDGIQPGNNARVLFPNDTDAVVKKTVYAVSYLPNPKLTGGQIISLNPAPEFSIVDGNELFVRGGITNGGKSFLYQGLTNTWITPQYKVGLNQYPLFDLVDNNGYSLSDVLVYPSSTFAGNKLFSYTPGTGASDPVLGFPIKYSSVGDIGDINFTVNYNSDTFTYIQSGSTSVTTKNVNLVGYVEYSPTAGTIENLNGWVVAKSPSIQNQVFQFKVEAYTSSITNITQGSPAVVTTLDDHNFVDGQPIVITNVIGMTDVNNQPYFAKVTSPTTVQLFLDAALINPVNTESFTAYNSGGFLSVRGQYTFVCDVPASSNTSWVSVQVYNGDNILDDTQFTYTVSGSKTTVTVNDIVQPTIKATILITSDVVSQSETSYYDYPTNLENNPFNEIVTNLDVGDIRNHYTSIYNNAPGVTGNVNGNNNLHNLGNLLGYGNQIIQNSASLVLPGLFCRNPQLNLFNAIQYSSEQYINYKQLITDLASRTELGAYYSAAEILDSIIQQIITTKTSKAFFWSDMLPSGNPYRSNVYFYEQATNEVIISLSQTYSFTEANYNGLCIYLRRDKNNNGQDIQLIRGIDYTVSEISPVVTITYPIQAGQSIVVKEYNQTYNSFCPNTPTKLGIYMAFKPAIVYDNSYKPATWFLQGHDGSYTKLYGTYDPATHAFTDYRDSVIFEFETRVYNNLKLDGHVLPLVPADIIPGQFRTTEYTNDEILEIYSINFLNWVGQNRIDYKDQQFSKTNPFTYNYNLSSNKLIDPLTNANTTLKQGYWRGVYRWLYDTDEPSLRPWEMLGLTQKPSWWESYYGPAPYTSTNTLLWNDLARGFVYNNGNSYIDPLRVRPQLSSVIPVDAEGTLLSPLEVVVSNYDSLTFERSWVVGDQAPAETAYLKSSTWPFDYARLLALTKPAQFFNYYVDADAYQYNTTQQQFLFNGHTHLDPRLLTIYGNGTSKTSYVDWIVDYVYVNGSDAYTAVQSALQNLDVRLTYRLAGFSDKSYLKFLVEKATPNDTNSSLLIPDDSYKILLYDDVPEYQINFSSLIIQKNQYGWQVWGNSQSKAYFKIAVPKLNGTYRTITASGVSVTLTGDYYEDKTAIVPYGTTFYSVQGIAEFIQNYAKYMLTLGVGVQPTGDNLALWDTAIIRYIVWAQQAWENGTTITLNPYAQEFTVNKDNYVVQPLTLHQKNFVLNQNLYPIQQQDLAVIRVGSIFNVKLLNDGDALSFTTLNLHQMEHAVVFDNYTVFNDTIYNLISGLRQQRLLMQSYITSDWQGRLDANGFIINQDNIQPWQTNTKYTKGQIVTTKGFYWSANVVIEPSQTFNENLWTKVSPDQIQLGVLPNPSTQAFESTLFYDVNNANLEQDSDLLSFSLIGYRPRPYMSAADLTDVTQVNVYKNILKEKGTPLLANSFKTAQFTQGKLDYDLREVWAIKNATFGSVLNSNFVDFKLNQNKLNSNPSTVGFSASADRPEVEQTVTLNDFINYERKPVVPNFLPVLTTNSNVNNGLPSAGYVNLNDAKLAIFQPSNLNDKDTNFTTMYRSDDLWIANYKGSWGIFAPDSIDCQVVQVINNLNGTITLTFNGQHHLAIGDIIVVLQFDPLIDRYYTVASVPSLFSITVAYNLAPTTTKLDSYGIAMKMVSQRAPQPSDVNDSRVQWSEFYTSRYWVDNDVDGYWSVYDNSPTFQQNTIALPSGLTKVGTAVATRDWLGTVVSGYDGGNAVTYRIFNGQVKRLNSLPGTSNYGKGIAVSKDQLFIAADGVVYVYDETEINNGISPVPQYLLQDITSGAIAVSSNGNWLYVADADHDHVYVFGRSNLNNKWIFSRNIYATEMGVQFGASLATTEDGQKLVIGAPKSTVGTHTQAGKAFVYSRGYNRWEYQGQTNFVLSSQPTEALTVKVYVNGVRVTAYTLTNKTIYLTNAPTYGSIIEVEFDEITLTSTLVSEQPRAFGGYGVSVSTNRYGSDVVVGAPTETHKVGETANVNGAVYVYINAGQRYGSLIGATAPFVNNNDRAIINGYQVTFAGTNSASDIAQQINDQTPTNILAGTAINSNGVTVLTIGVITNTAEVAYDIVDFVSDETVSTQLGFINKSSTDPIEVFNINLYTPTQLITNLYNLSYGDFGSRVAMNESNGLIISGILAPSFRETTFDFVDDLKDDDTIFDNGATIFIEQNEGTGAVYEYQYLPAYNESITNPGQYVFGQNLTPEFDLSAGGYSQRPQYGQSIGFYGDNVVVGAPNLYANGSGSYFTFNNGGIPTWFIEKHSNPVVDINSLNYISIYDTTDNETLEYLDYIDPLQGKMLGAVLSNLDYWQENDPAGYGKTELSWGKREVGRTWLDTNKLRVLDYHQPDLTYNAKYWAQTFPGSTADIYTWIETNLSPLNYAGPGYVTNFNDYVEEITLDESTNSLTTTYYYWVKAYTLIPTGKSLSPFNIAQYIINPQSSGISYLAPLSTSTIALYNVENYLNAETSALHLGYAVGQNADNAHQTWTLIDSNDPDSFLNGFPFDSNEQPSGLYLKLLDSFSGYNTNGQTVPDQMLPELLKYGVSVRPRQSMLPDRSFALYDYISFVNDIMVDVTVTETRIFTFLTTSGTGWDTADYWAYQNWWLPGYSNNTKPDIEVPYIVALYKITPYQGMIARVTSNYQGVGETFRWTKETGWYRIGLDNGTIQFKSTIWTDAAIKTANPVRNIIRWINEELFTQDLYSYRNTGLILLFTVIMKEAQEQGNYLPWLNKTSFVDVDHTVRQLLQYKKFQRDNTEFLAGYLNEVKPYHVVIKDFLFRYTGEDVYTGSVTDFDVPAQYNVDFEKFVSPQLIYTGAPTLGEYLPNATIWTTAAYTDWFNNFGLSISNADIGNVVVTTTSATVGVKDSSISLTSTYGVPESGIVTIETEEIKYNSVDRVHNKLTDLIRNYGGTSSTVHPANSPVIMTLPSVIVLDPGRGYENPPKITVSIDTEAYPAPREVAKLNAVLGDPLATIPQDPSKVYSINVVNAGSGYAIKPTVHIEPSIVKAFVAADPITNVLTLEDVTYDQTREEYVTLHTGDSVIYRSTKTTGPSKLQLENYYYSRIAQCPLALNTWVGGTTYQIGDVVKYRADTNHPFQQYTCLAQNNNATFDPTLWRLTPYVQLFSSYYNSVTNGVPAWSTEFAYVSGDKVQYQGYIYESNIIPLTVTGATQTSPAVVTLNTTSGLVDGNQIEITNIKGMTELNNNIYFVNVVNSTQVELYSALVDGVLTTPVNATEFNAYTSGGQATIVRPSFVVSDWTNIAVADYTSIAPATPVGSNGIGTLSLTPRIAFFTTNQPVREIKTTVKFDRTAYTSKIIPWAPAVSSTLLTSINTTDLVLYVANSSTLPEKGTLTLPGGTVGIVSINGTDNTLVCDSSTYLRVNDPLIFNKTYGNVVSGTTYYILSIDTDYNKITISTSLGGPEFDLLTVASPVNMTGQLESEQITYGYNNVSTNRLSNVVRGANGTLVQPHAADSSVQIIYNAGTLVLYPNTETKKLYNCVVQNTDTEFNYSNWVQIFADDPLLTAADRIIAFYRPTINMPGIDLTQLMEGVTYPNNTYAGLLMGAERAWDVAYWDAGQWENASVESRIDTNLVSPNFTNSNYDPAINPNYVDVVGTPFGQGYGPEELIPGLTYDVIDINVRSKPGSSWNPRDVVDNSGDVPTLTRTPTFFNAHGDVLITELPNNGVGESLYFNGASYLTTNTGDTPTVQVSYPTQKFDFGSGDFTIEFWMNIGRAATSQIIYNGQQNTANGWSVGVTDDKRITFISLGTGADGGLTTWSTPINAFNLSQFTNVSLVRNGNDLTAYVGTAGGLNTEYRMVSSINITGITNSSPAYVTVASADAILVDGQRVSIASVVGMTQINNTTNTPYYYVKTSGTTKTTSATVSSGSTTIPLNNTASLVPGMLVSVISGAIPPNATIQTVNSANIVISSSTTASIPSGTVVTLTNNPEQLALYYDAALTSPVVSTTYGSYTSGGTMLRQDDINFPDPLPFKTKFTITGVTKATTAVVDLAATPIQNFVDGELIIITGVGGMTELNNNLYYVKPTTYTNQFELYTDIGLTTPVDSTTFGTYTSGGYVNVFPETWIGQGYNINPTPIPLFGGSIQPFTGYVEELRISNTNRYTQPYKPQVGTFANDSNTLLLVHPFGLPTDSIILDDVGTTIDATGFNVKRFDATASATPLSFDGEVLNPVGIDVYVYNGSGTSPAFVRDGTNYLLPANIYDNPDELFYSVDWTNKTITFHSTLYGSEIQVAVYELGGGNQLARNSSDNTPLIEVPATPTGVVPSVPAHSIIELDVEFVQYIPPSNTNAGTTVTVWVSDNTVATGMRQLSYNADYTVQRDLIDNSARIVFTQSYAGQYVTYAILGWIQTTIAPTVNQNIGANAIDLPGYTNILPYNISIGDIVSFDDGVNNYTVTAVTSTTLSISPSLVATVVAGTPMWFYNPSSGYSAPTRQEFRIQNPSIATYALTDFIEDTNAGDIIVQLNDKRLVPDTDYTVDAGTGPAPFALNNGGTLTLNVALNTYDVVSIISFGRLAQQSLSTQDVTGSIVNKVITINYSPNNSTPASVVTDVAHGITVATQIKIDAIDATTTPLNGNYYWVDPVDTTTLDLYYDELLTQPAIVTSNIGYSSTTLGSGASYLFVASDFTLEQPSYFNLINPERLWVTVNGYYINTNFLKLGVNANHNTVSSATVGNVLSILYPIQSSDEVVITSFTPMASPDEESFLVSVNYQNQPTVFRTNWDTKTYLTQTYDNSLPAPSDALYVNDIYRLLDVRTTTQSFITAFESVNVRYKSGTGTNLVVTGDSADEVIAYMNKFVGLASSSFPTAVSFDAGEQIASITKASTAVVTINSATTLTNGQRVMITHAQGMTQINGNIYYAKVTSTTPTQSTIELYTNSGLTTGVNSTTFGAYIQGSADITAVAYVTSYTKTNATDVSMILASALPSTQYVAGANLNIQMAVAKFGVLQVSAIKTKPTTVALNVGTILNSSQIEQFPGAGDTFEIWVPKVGAGNYAVTTYVGDTVWINGEYIRFLNYGQDNSGNWYIYQLIRGYGKTIVNTYLPKATPVQSILFRNRMSQEFYNEDWYDYTDTPLQINNSEVAVFLRTPTN